MTQDAGRLLHEDQALVHLGQRLAELCREATNMSCAPLHDDAETETLLMIREEICDLVAAIGRLTPASEEGRRAKQLAALIAAALPSPVKH